MMAAKLARRLRYQRHTLILLLAALALLGLLIAFAPLTTINYWGIDIYTFRAAARAMALNENPYEEANILRFADDVTVGNIHDYIYAPYFAFALRPLTWLSPETASRLWFILNLILYFCSILLVLRVINWQPSGNSLLLMLIGLILFPPLRTTLTIGQSTVLILFFFSLALFLLKNKHSLWGGLVFSLALFKPHLAPILLFFVLLRHWKFISGVLWGVLLLNLPFLNWLNHWVVAATTTRTANLSFEECFQMVSATSLLHCTVAPHLSQLFIAFISLMAGAVVIGIDFLYRAGKPNLSLQTPEFDRYLGLVVVLNGLTVDHTRIADQLVFVVPLLALWRDWPYFASIRVKRIAVGLISSIYLLPYVLDFFQNQGMVYLLPFWYIGISLVLLILLLSYQISKPVE